MSSAVLHQRILYVFETNTSKNVLEVYIRIYVRMFVYYFVHINVHTPKCIFVCIWIYTVCICKYPCSYLQASQSVYACIPVSICTTTVHVSLFVSACFPVCICKYPCSYLHVSYPVSECVYPHGAACIPFVSERITCSYLFVPCLCLHFQFNAHSANHRPSRPAKLQHTQTHTQPLTHPHSLCSVFLTPVHKCRCLVIAASATASVGVTTR